MAGSYKVLSANATVELVGGDQTQDVQQLTLQAIPSGAVFPVRVPLAGFTPEAVTAKAEPLAAALNALAADPGVSAVSVVQDVNAAGQLEDRVTVTVTTGDGQLSTAVDAPLGDALRGTLDAKIAAALANLEAVAGL